MRQRSWDTKFVNSYIELLKDGDFRSDIRDAARRELNLPGFAVLPEVFISPYDSIGTRKALRKISDGKRVLEIGSGTGWNSIVAAQSGANEVVATDISESALDNTRLNINNANFQSTIQVYRSDLFDKVPTRKYDIIVANLPFDNSEFSNLDGLNIATRDPGFELNKRFLREVRNYLLPDGQIIFNHSNFSGMKSELVGYIMKNGFYVAHLSKTQVPWGKLNRKFYTIILKQEQFRPKTLEVNPILQPTEFFRRERVYIDNVWYLREIQGLPQYPSWR
jgi:release factor glutamine methyltransferase